MTFHFQMGCIQLVNNTYNKRDKKNIEINLICPPIMRLVQRQRRCGTRNLNCSIDTFAVCILSQTLLFQIRYIGYLLCAIIKFHVIQ